METKTAKSRKRAVDKFLKSFTYKPGFTFTTHLNEEFFSLIVNFTFKSPIGEIGFITVNEAFPEPATVDKGELLRLLWDTINKIESFERMHWFQISGSPYIAPKFKSTGHQGGLETTFWPTFPSEPL